MDELIGWLEKQQEYHNDAYDELYLRSPLTIAEAETRDWHYVHAAVFSDIIDHIRAEDDKNIIIMDGYRKKLYEHRQEAITAHAAIAKEQEERGTTTSREHDIELIAFGRQVGLSQAIALWNEWRNKSGKIT